MVEKDLNSEANAQRIATVEYCFGSSGEPLAIQGRVLVGDGVLTKMCRKKPKPRQFFLFNDILVYGNIIIPKKKYNKQHIIPLEAVKLENLEDEGAVKNGWLIRTPTKSFAVYAATASEKTEWMAHINKCVEDLIRKTGKKPSKEHAAVWVPDSEASVCMHCRKSQFTIINRKHHCRKCGAVVCNPCSSKKFLLPTQSSKPLRVCLHCYDTLSKSKSDAQQIEKVDAAKVPPVNVTVDSSGDEDSDEGDEEEQEKQMTIEDEEDATKDMEELHIQEKPTFYQDTDVSATKQENAVDNQTLDVPNDQKQLQSAECNPTISDTAASNSISEPTTMGDNSASSATEPATEPTTSCNDE